MGGNTHIGTVRSNRGIRADGSLASVATKGSTKLGSGIGRNDSGWPSEVIASFYGVVIKKWSFGSGHHPQWGIGDEPLWSVRRS